MSHYKLTSTVILHLANKTEALGDMDLSGNMTRQVEVDLPVESDGSHVANVGRLVEDMELKMRNLLRMFPGSVDFEYMLNVTRLQRRSTSARQRMWLASSEVSCRIILRSSNVLIRNQAWDPCPTQTEIGRHSGR
jgi:hypothetical protein